MREGRKRGSRLTNYWKTLFRGGKEGGRSARLLEGGESVASTKKGGGGGGQHGNLRWGGGSGYKHPWRGDEQRAEKSSERDDCGEKETKKNFLKGGFVERGRSAHPFGGRALVCEVEEGGSLHKAPPVKRGRCWEKKK